MGTLLKYLIYALIIIAIYLVGVGFYEGAINKNTTVGEVTNDVTQGTKEIIKDGYETTKEGVQEGYDSMKNNLQDSNTEASGGFKEN